MSTKKGLYHYNKKRCYDAKVMLGGCCVDCGETNLLYLHFDHIWPETKRHTVSHMTGYSDIIFQEEVFKCQLRCVPCHHQRTREQRANGQIKLK